MSARRIRVLLEGIDNFRHWTVTAADFTRMTGIEVDFDLFPWPVLIEKTRETFEAAQSPYDVVAVDESSLAKYARAGAVRFVDDFLERSEVDFTTYSRQALECVRLDGRTAGVPYSNMTNLLFFREDIFDKYSVKIPRTLDELASTAMELQQSFVAAGESGVYGIVSRGKSVAALENVWIFASSIAPAFGASWIDDEGRCCFHTQEMAEALEYYAGLLRGAGPPDAAEMDYVATSAAYFEGRAAMLIEVGCSVVSGLATGTPAARNTRTALIPAGPGGNRHAGLWVPAWSIPAAARDADAAWEFVAWAVSADVAARDLQGGHVEQARFSALMTPEALERYPADLVDAVITTRAFAQNERPLVDDWFELGNALGDAVEDVVAGRIDASEALAHAEQVVQAATGRISAGSAA